MQDADTASSRFPERVQIRSPRGLPRAIELAARRQHTVPAEYCRRAILGALQADGVRLLPDGEIEGPGFSGGSA
jgi:hypothetical protein